MNFSDIGADEYFYSDGVCIIEWLDSGDAT